MKKIIIIAIVIIVAALLFVMFQGQSVTESQNLNWQDFKKKAQKTNTVIIDIRTADEYHAGKLFSDAIVDFDYYESDFEQKVSKLDKNKTYLIYCRSGNRTEKSLKVFKKHGLKAYDLDGGHKSTPPGSLK